MTDVSESLDWGQHDTLGENGGLKVSQSLIQVDILLFFRNLTKKHELFCLFVLNPVTLLVLPH